MPARAVRIPRTFQQLRQLIAFHPQTLRRSYLKGERSLADGGRTLAWAAAFTSAVDRGGLMFSSN